MNSLYKIRFFSTVNLVAYRTVQYKISKALIFVYERAHFRQKKIQKKFIFRTAHLEAYAFLTDEHVYSHRLSRGKQEI